MMALRLALKFQWLDDETTKLKLSTILEEELVTPIFAVLVILSVTPHSRRLRYYSVDTSQ